jgi:ABC-type branched-subunit amino acid transport system substrate-binding protein
VEGRIGGVSGVPADKRPPVITLTANSAATAPGVLAFVSDEIDSALAGMRAAAKDKKLVVLAPEGTSETAEQRLRNGAKMADADLAAFLRYAKSEPEFRALLLKNLEHVSSADAVLILGGDGRPATLARLVGAANEKEGSLIIGTSAWPREVYADPAVAGALLALVDQGSLAIVSGRYKERFGRPLSLEAAFAYDAVGIVCGIIRARGADALTVEALHSPTGFRGTTGIFRFTKEGHVQRRFALYRIEKNEPTQVRSMPVGF